MHHSQRSKRGRILTIDLERFAPRPLYRRIYESIRRDIVGGVLLPGMQLPSSRQLAADLDVSRGTVVLAYDLLGAEGYLDADGGGATRVARAIPDVFVSAAPPIASAPRRTEARASQRGEHLARELADLPIDLTRSPRAFRTTPPAIDVFPVDVWRRLAAQQWRRATTRDLSYGSPLGFPPLRRAIADYVRATRGVRCAADDIMVVSGAQHGLDIAARALLDPGDDAWLEDPGYFGARGALVAAGATIVPIGVDEQGVDVREGRRLAPNARLAIVTPSHQMPLGMPLSAERRRELLDWADDANAWIFEDDYNSDFHYASQPAPALKAGDRSDRVIYCGTFDKSLFPGLRIGFLVVPPSVASAFTATRVFSDLQQSYLDQATLTAFITEGHYERHVRRLRSIYLHRRELLLRGLDQCARWLTPARLDSGREMTVALRAGIDDVHFAQAAERAGVSVMPLTPWVATHRIAPTLRLGYSGIDDVDITRGVRLLAEVFDAFTATELRPPHAVPERAPRHRGRRTAS